MTPEERREQQRKNQDYFSEKLSELARNIGFGLAAIAFTLLSSDSTFATSLAEAAGVLVVIAAALGCLTVLCDFLQLFCGWRSASIAAENASGNYEMKTPKTRKLQFCFFYAKQGLAFTGAVILLIAIGTQI